MKFKISLIFKIVFTLVLLIIIGVVVWQLLTSLRSHQLLTNAEVARKAGKPIPVHTVVAERGSLDSLVAAECTVKESARVGMSIDTSGSVVSANANVGDAVSQGQILLKLDDEILKAVLENTKEAEMTLQVLRDELVPFIIDLRGLRKKNLVPINTLLDAIDMQRRAELDLIRVRREKFNAEHSLLKTSIAAPISGLLTSVDAIKGSVLRPYQEFLVISQLDPILLECQFAEDMLPTLNDFDKADATFPALTGKTFSVELEKILPVAHANTHAIIAQFSLPNKDHSLMPGMAAVVRLNKVAEGLRVPSVSLINTDGERANVFVIDKKNVARLLSVELGRYSQGYTEVKSGLSDGQKVVIVGQGSLKDGDKVNIGASKSANVGILKTLFRPESR